MPQRTDTDCTPTTGSRDSVYNYQPRIGGSGRFVVRLAALLLLSFLCSTPHGLAATQGVEHILFGDLKVDESKAGEKVPFSFEGPALHFERRDHLAPDGDEQWPLSLFGSGERPLRRGGRSGRAGGRAGARDGFRSLQNRLPPRLEFRMERWRRKGAHADRLRQRLLPAFAREQVTFREGAAGDG